MWNEERRKRDNEIALRHWRNEQFITTGTIAQYGASRYGSIDSEELWEMMYIKPKPVIIVCGYCKSHNAITNPTCVQCGAPMGAGVQRIYA